MKIRILWVGKSKDSYIKAAIDEFITRIKPYSDVDVILIPDVKLSGTNNPGIVVQREGIRIAKYLNEKVNVYNKPAYVICLDSQGEMLNSVAFAQLIFDKFQYNEILFIIGGVYGLSDEVKKRADKQVSLSKMTFTHQISRIILLEQLYRAFTIINKKKYHY